VKGVIFDIKEFALHDGPGIRTTVFFKGCPLRCSWCHNPESISRKKQIFYYRMKCMDCGVCREKCEHPDKCIACGSCTLICPANARKIAGQEISSKGLAGELNNHSDFFRKYGGGITFSGGEPLGQPEFLLNIIDRLDDIHLTLDTCGHADTEVFKKAADKVNLVLFDLKHTDPAVHKKFTGVDNKLILQNLEELMKMKTEFILRIPLIPDVNDDAENMKKINEIVKGALNLLEIDILPYHKTAGAKYSPLGMKYEPGFDAEKNPNNHSDILIQDGYKVITL